MRSSCSAMSSAAPKIVSAESKRTVEFFHRQLMVNNGGGASPRSSVGQRLGTSGSPSNSSRKPHPGASRKAKVVARRVGRSERSRPLAFGRFLNSRRSY
jgi:hypothetical protein